MTAIKAGDRAAGPDTARMRKLISSLGYPVLVMFPVAVSFAALKAFPLSPDPLTGQVQEVALFLVIAIPVVATLILLERHHAARRQVVSRVDLRTDVVHLGMCWFVLNPIAQQLMRVLALVTAGRIAALNDAPLWPTQWPLLAQLLLAVVVGEFGTYWFHRLAHETGIGWRIHATHHGTPQVYWLNSTRFHALELFLRTIFQIGPLILLGCSREAFLVYGIFISIHGWVQHSNVAYATGPLDFVMATPKNHRWHHSTVISESNTNYGLIVALWDHVFRTFYSPRDRESPAEIGISDLPNFPKGYLGQFLTPFAWERLLRSQPTAARTSATADAEAGHAAVASR